MLKSTSPIQTAPPSPLRWLILGLLFAISIVTYIDRVNISVTARHMMPALGLTDQEMGFVFSAFVVGYALFQIPGGWLGDRWGIRIVLMVALIWWSCFTAWTAIVATSFLAGPLGIVGALALVRFLLGVGEAAALPTFNRAVTDWLPAHERGLGIGIAIGGIGIGAAITPPVTAWIMVNYGWQAAFYLSSGIGFGLAVIWWLLAADRPPHHQSYAQADTPPPTIPPAPAQPSIPWALLRRTPSVWWLMLSYGCLGYVAYVYMSWFYLYLVNERGFSVLRGGLFAAAPFLAILVSCPLGGWVTDRLAIRRGVTEGRQIVGMTGMGMAAGSIALGAAAESPYLALASLSLGAGWLYFTVGAYWSSTSDLSATHAGSLSGLMNMGANLGGAISPTLTPWIAQQWGWGISLGLAAAVSLLGGIMWLRIRPGDGLAKDGAETRVLRGYFQTQHSDTALLAGPCHHEHRLVTFMTMVLEFRKKDPRVTITTRFGEIKIRFYPDAAPRHVENFINLAKMGFYDGTTFHRVVPGFIIQGGDPLSKSPDRTLHGTGGPGYFLSPEPNDRPHKRGAVSMAKMPRESNSTRDFNDNGSQFFICVGDNSGLDRRYTVFGEVFRGIEVVDKIVSVLRDERDNPLDPIRITMTVKE